MQTLIVSKSELSGQVRMPGSKSHTIRAIALGAMASGKSIISSPLMSLDAKSAVNCYRAMGAKINTEVGDKKNPIWSVEGFAGSPAIPDNVIDVGNSGTSLRLALGSASLIDKGEIIFTGDRQIRRRPAGALIKSLNELGANVRSSRGNDLPPFIVAGKLVGGETQMEAISSQYLSALLMSCPLAEKNTKIILTLLNEIPYVEITLGWLDKLGIKYTNNDFKSFEIPGGQKYNAFECSVPADFSSATFFLCGAALTGKDVKILGLDLNDKQGDKAVISYLRQMGAKIEITDDAIIINSSELCGANLDLNATPDALPAMAVTACFANSPTKLYNVAQARIKETDRIKVMTTELKKLGADITELPDGLEIRPAKLKGGVVEGNDDHRVVMAMSLAGLKTYEPVIINGAQAIAVTFPDYTDLMNQLGGKMEIKKLT